MLQERDAKDSEKDQLIANLQAQLDYLKTRLFGLSLIHILKSHTFLIQLFAEEFYIQLSKLIMKY